ncbi:MAG: hypothetical protein ACE5LU_06440 [Anaerolineae bacterium]
MLGSVRSHPAYPYVVRILDVMGSGRHLRLRLAAPKSAWRTGFRKAYRRIHEAAIVTRVSSSVWRYTQEVAYGDG